MTVVLGTDALAGTTAEILETALGRVVRYPDVQRGVADQNETTATPLPFAQAVRSSAEITLALEDADWGVPTEVVEHEHSYAWRGEASRYGITGTTTARCQRPILFRCVLCPEYYLANCNSKDSSECEPCELRYRTRVRSVLRIPMLASRPGSVFLFTLTAPGARRHCLTHTYTDKKGAVQPSVRCKWEDKLDSITGEIVSVPVDDSCVECVCSDNRLTSRHDISEFNYALANMWNRFMTYVRRYSPEAVNGRSNKASRPFAGFEYAKAIEPQKRGALHIHALIRTANPMALTPEVLAAFKAIAMEIGFGHQFDVQVVGGKDLDMVTASRYVAKYVSKRNSSSDPDIPFPRTRTEMVRGERTRGYERRGASSGHRMSAKAYSEVRKAPEGLQGSHVTPAGETVEHTYTTQEYSQYVIGYGQVRVPMERKVKPPRAWSVSRNWGLSMTKIIKQQMLWQYDKESGAKRMMELIWTVFAHQMGIANPMKPQLAITA